MGEWVTKLLGTEYAQKATLVGAPARGQPLDALLTADAIIDFSSPLAMMDLAQVALKHSGALPVFVVGSTGWKLEERRSLEELAKKTPVLMASNFSTGVSALIEVLKLASPLIEKLGYTPVIRETHHKNKKDSPSGTALSLQRSISPAGPGNVQTFSVRAGEIIGDHEVTYYGVGDHLTFGHFAQDRSVFARGAIDVALWLASKRGQALGGSLIGIEKYFEELKKP